MPFNPALSIAEVSARNLDTLPHNQISRALVKAHTSLYLRLNKVFQNYKGGEYQISRVRIKLFCDFELKFDFCLISTGF